MTTIHNYNCRGYGWSVPLVNKSNPVLTETFRTSAVGKPVPLVTHPGFVEKYFSVNPFNNHLMPDMRVADGFKPPLSTHDYESHKSRLIDHLRSFDVIVVLASLGDVPEVKAWIEGFYVGEALLVETFCGSPEPYGETEGEHNYTNLAHFLVRAGVSSMETVGELGFRDGGCAFVATAHFSRYLKVGNNKDLVFPGRKHVRVMG